jgi:type I restriction enzyme R subunit
MKASRPLDETVVAMLMADPEFAHFGDPEWDGEPLAPAEPEPRPPRTGNGATDVPAGEPTPTPFVDPPPAKIKVELADGKERKILHMTATTFWSADGRPMSAAQFLEMLYGALPEFFKDEDELRRIWSVPDTRKALLAGPADKGFGREPLAEMQKIIEAENSDLFDVLAYVAFAAGPVTRADRAAAAKSATGSEFTDKQQGFVEFVLAQYVKQGVDELDAEKLSPFLKLKYRNALADAFAELGQPDQVRQVFVGFQRHLYAAEAAPPQGHQ